MRYLQMLLGATLCAGLAGCPRTNPIECVDDTSCDLSPGGACTVAPSGNQWCAYPDLTCPGGLRYSDLHVGDGLGGACVNADVDAGPVDVVPPTLLSHTPDNLAANVPIGTAVTATFSEDILVGSVTPTTFTVRAGATAVPGTIAVVGPTASFVPSMRLSPTIDYSVALTTGITDRAGNALRDEVRWSFRTGAGGWTVRQPLESDVTHSADTVSVATSANGHGVAVWFMGQPFAATYANGSWNQGAAIAAANTNRPGGVTIDSQGRATVFLKGGGQLQAVVYAGGTWGQPTEIDAGTGNIGVVSAGTDDSGNVVVVWQQFEGAIPSIWASRYTPGGMWSAAIRLESSAAVAQPPSLAVLRDGSAFALWAQSNTILYARMNAGGVWASAAEVGAGTASAPTVAVGANGALTAVWPAGNALRASRYTGAWDAPVAINGGTGDPFADSVRIVALPSGKTMAFWLAGNPGFQNLIHAIYTPGSGWSPATAIDVLSGGVNDQSAAAGMGDMVLAGWSQAQGTAGAVPSGWANVFDGTTGWGEPQLFETDESHHVVDAQTYYDSATNTFGVVWIQSVTGGLPSVFYSELR